MDKKILKNLIKPAFGILLVFAVWWLIRCQCINLKAVTPASLKGYIQGFGRLAALVYVLAYALNTISIFPPIALLSLTAGLAFGKLWGAVYLMTGAMLGTSCTFFISRFFGRGIVERLLKGRFRNFDQQLEKRGLIAVLFFRIVPLIPYEGLNYISGLSKIKFRHYFLATFLGLIPGVVVSAFFGDALTEIKGSQDLLSLRFLLAALALIILITVPFIYLHLKKRIK